MPNSTYENIFAKLRINFLFNHPFLSVLALSIPTIFTKNKKSPFSTDGATLSIDLEKLEKYNEANITYLYAHTLLHIVLKHPFRQKTRDAYIWNMACDLVINNILASFTNVGVIPDDEIVDFELKEKCVEEVYEILYKKEEEKKNENSQNENEDNEEIKTTPNQNGKQKAYIYDSSKLDLEEVTDEKTSKGDQEKLDGIIIQALSIANKNTTLYSGLQIEINTLIKPKIDLQESLKEYLISSSFEKKTSYKRADKRFIHSGLYLPGSEKNNENIEIYVAIDSSSSVSVDEYKKFLGIIKEICESFYEYKMVILPFDLKVKVDFIKEFDSFNSINKDDFLIPKSDGGTDFDEVIRYLKKSTDSRSENLLLVLSDGEFELNESLVCETVFIISDKKNLQKFQHYGRVIEFIL
ncbi:MAG: hypothetical protein PHF17_08555 [Arcobacteraceae bacterium]|nr:hypothetical protein [Arcobacteraceae bacterium]